MGRMSGKGRSFPFRGEGGKVRYRRVSPIAPRPREGRLTEPIAGAQPWLRERVLMPHCGHCPNPYAGSQWVWKADLRLDARSWPTSPWSASGSNEPSWR